MQLCVLFVFFLVKFSFANDFFSVEGKLIETILENYSPQVSPVEENGLLNISLSLTLSQVIDINEKAQEMTTSVYGQYIWVDKRLSWTPEKYNDIKLIRLPADTIWKPRFLLENSKDGSFDVSLETNLLIYSHGLIEWLPPALYKTSCAIEIGMFPFDKQKCKIKMFMPEFDMDEMILVLPTNTVYIDLGAYQPNGEWDLKGSEVDINERRDGYVFSLLIERMPLFYIVNIILPCVLLSSMSCLVFYLPSNTCEKFTLQISILLGQTVFVFLIAQRVPETSLAVPLIAAFVLFLMSLVCVSLILSVIICNINFRSNNSHKMPVFLNWFFIEILAPILNVERPSSDENDSSSSNSESSSVDENSKFPSKRIFRKYAGDYNLKARKSPGNLKQPDDVIKPPAVLNLPPSVWSVLESICYIAKRLKQDDHHSQSQDDWSYLALILDRLFLWIYTATFFLGIFGFFIKAWHG